MRADARDLQTDMIVSGDAARLLSTEPRPLPFGARELSRHHDLEGYRPLFGLYLDVQKRIELADLEDQEVKGRWKSFVNKWYGCDTHQPFPDHYQQNSANMLGTMET